MGKTGEYAFFQGQVFKQSGTKAAMDKLARAVKLGHAAVWKLTPEGNRIGKPVAKYFNGVKVK